MRTFSHAIVTTAIGRKTQLERGSLFAFVLGSVLPDLPVGVLTVLALLENPDMEAAMVIMDRAFYSSPLWIALHNTPHSFVAMGILSLLVYPFRQRRWGRWLLWYAAGATLHIIIDIVTHAGDGPMFLYPLSDYRFDSPVSYWDPAYYGRAFTAFEYALDALLLLYIGLTYWRGRERRG